MYILPSSIEDQGNFIGCLKLQDSKVLSSNVVSNKHNISECFSSCEVSNHGQIIYIGYNGSTCLCALETNDPFRVFDATDCDVVLSSDCPANFSICGSIDQASCSGPHLFSLYSSKNSVIKAFCYTLLKPKRH